MIKLPNIETFDSSNLVDVVKALVLNQEEISDAIGTSLTILETHVSELKDEVQNGFQRIETRLGLLEDGQDRNTQEIQSIGQKIDQSNELLKMIVENIKK